MWRATWELYFQNSLYLLFRLMGFLCAGEYPTSQGRIDVIIRLPTISIIIECKLDGSADEALQQIITNNYAAPFAGDPVLCSHWREFLHHLKRREKWVIG